MFKEIILTRGKVAVVDDKDYDMLVALGMRWCVSDGYAFNRALGRMHRFLLEAPAGVMVDHRNGDRLDNRRENLRLCTNSQNQANRKVVRGVSNFKGVTWQKRTHGGGYWKAQIVVNGVIIGLGSHRTDLDAAIAYNAGATKYFGEFAHINDLTLTPSEMISNERRQVARANSSGIKGVYFDETRDRWVAQLVAKGVTYLRKRFKTAEEAARAYDASARAVYGNTAATNFN
jgi:hypothetical protein